MKIKILLAGLALSLLAYIYACFSTLNSLDGKDLIQMRILAYHAPAEPVIVPMPRYFKDVFWKTRGEERVLSESKLDRSLRSFAIEAYRHAGDSGDPVDETRAVELFKLLGVSNEQLLMNEDD